MTDERKQYAPLRSFGRVKGRKLHKGRQALFDTLLPKLLIKNVRGHAEEFFTTTPRSEGERSGGGTPPNNKKNSSLWLEIGFGAGEHLAEQAARNPDVNFVGCEPYINGVASLLARIEKDKITNIRLYDNDARVLLETLPDHSIEKIFVLFPDPWPKVRHHKKRLVSLDTLTLLHKKIKPGGRLRLATDHVDYATWMLEKLLAFGKFEWQARAQADWNTEPSDWVRTRYQEKAALENRKAVFLDWVAC